MLGVNEVLVCKKDSIGRTLLGELRFLFISVIWSLETSNSSGWLVSLLENLYYSKKTYKPIEGDLSSINAKEDHDHLKTILLEAGCNCGMCEEIVDRLE